MLERQVSNLLIKEVDLLALSNESLYLRSKK